MSEEQLRAAIVHHLIEATPEWWDEGTLEIEVDRRGEITSISHLIESPVHPKDIVATTDELMEAVRIYEFHHAKEGNLLGKFTLSFHRNPEGKWAYTLESVFV